MTKPWPTWATLRPEQVSELPAGEQGPWKGGGTCRLWTAAGVENHPTEPPFFFHCRKHLDQVRAKSGAVDPWPNRDQGLCTVCGNPAEKRKQYVSYKALCLKAEQKNSTVARLSTKRFCADCDKMKDTLCNGIECRRAKERHQVLAHGCCRLTEKGKKSHCQMCCEAGEAKHRTRDYSNQNASLKDSYIKRTRVRDGRRDKVALLRALGLRSNEISLLTGVSTNTIRSDSKAIRESQSQPPRGVAAPLARRRSRIVRLHSKGMPEEQIARQIKVTPRTVQDFLKTVREITGETS